ncbi:hypothetical protein MJ_1114 [Methanocaldococcus jannaschii DSM 2661]|uniref:Uncharacterized protein MJ1114 n=1 Tax=Methanocaldococcus jannaschii (strain ATCC 43067 / DSM 2661 / JAL-1 / JCM 10045 / NBRC 100440) TaxID=243232 RepID=Y1114_METJA|nr:hypothetical protein [Methanocaldococcus jannaschii]Q58514.3 RecName: Full=Uncharacterized protein MJ1114 [Methanocaldococcus jannaschii DSM 2661]AAB99122.1 hypothetical protein MJ_1114 [Methanocaldococcus jannaschii DSM 2661]
MDIVEKVYKEGILKLKENIPQIIINLVVAGLIWVFGILVFIPIADMLGNPYLFGLTALKPIISAIITIALIIVLLRVTKDFGELMDGIADIIAVKLAGSRVNEEKLKKYRRGLRGLAYLIVAIIAYLFFLPVISGITPVLAGIVLIILVLWAVTVLINIGHIFSEEIEEGIRIATEKLEKALEKSVKNEENE